MEQEYVTVCSIRMAMKSKRVVGVGMGMGLRRRWARQDLLSFIGDWLWRSCSELGVDLATCCGHVRFGYEYGLFRLSFAFCFGLIFSLHLVVGVEIEFLLSWGVGARRVVILLFLKSKIVCLGKI